MEAFNVEADADLAVMRSGQSLTACASRILAGLEAVIHNSRPQWIVVQGDTTSTICGALAGFYAGIPVAHVEAGLRTGDIRRPFPEEMHRVLTTRMASAHFAATAAASDALTAEGVSPSRIEVTGNTGTDALLAVKAGLERGTVRGLDCSWIDPDRKLVTATAHRRESFGPGFDRISHGLRRLAERPGVQLVCLPHPNPSARRALMAELEGSSARVLEQLPYAEFVDLLRRSYFVVTDSGGIQEEAPALGVPTLVLRDVTERTEAVEAGSAVLVGSSTSRLLAEAETLLGDPAEYRRRSQVRLLYGDGKACGRIESGLQRIGGRRTLAAAI